MSDRSMTPQFKADTQRHMDAAIKACALMGESIETDRVIAALDDIAAVLEQRGLTQFRTRDAVAEAIYDVLYNDVTPEVDAVKTTA